ncbi:MAG TPA: right-handed parallel beta-helix repeat-containing protein, partial [Solirubrobacteraceae bacterium]|nr:right-handed parallel beta-helix repeat-containing protein [Solirubrobacteraceae bacterium]
MGNGLRIFLTVAAVLGALATAALSKSQAAHLYVSPKGSDQAQCTRQQPCRTISRAVALAHPGDQVDVAAGIYTEEVRLTKRLELIGSHTPEIRAKGRARGILIQGAGAAGSLVRGFLVEGARYEGILALSTQRVTIAKNVVRHNDRGFFEKKFTGECAYNGQPPVAHTADLRAGGCGEAIHLASTSNSRVIGNLVTDNTGGIYLTDESGPASHNLVASNVVEQNPFDCGITLASHSRRTVSQQGRPLRAAGGVYDNTITHNIASLNGLRVPGAGVLVAAAYPGGAAYNNRIVANTINENGLPGVALHSHASRQYLDGNVILNNIVGRNALGSPSSGPGDGDGGVKRTTGILVWSWVTKITGTRIAGNRISHDYFGIWTK